jgi:hypothetical protein
VISRNKPKLPLGMTHEDLPAWMRRTRRELDWAFLVVGVLCIVVVWPFIVRSGLPYTTDARLEVIRTIEMAESLQAGILYPRWAPDFNYGYGSPLWNYLAPLPHYVTGLHNVLAQSSPETSVKFGFVMSLIMGGLGLFSFARRRWGTYAGVVAAAVFLYSPQIALVKPYLEGDLAGLLAIGVFSVALWAFDRVLVVGRGWDISVGVLVLAALWLTKTPLNVVLAGVLLDWVCWRLFVMREQGLGRLRAFGVYGLGTVLSAFYWLPAWAERSAVRWQATTHDPFRRWTPLTLRELLTYPDQVDLSAINPIPTAAIGVAVWGLALAGLIGVVIWNWSRTPVLHTSMARGEVLQQRIIYLIRTLPAPHQEVVYFVLIGWGGFVLLLPFTSVFWDILPGWPSLYPRDLLPLVVLCGALVAAQIGFLLEQVQRPVVAVAGIIITLVFVLVSALSTLYPPAWSAPDTASDLSSVLRDEVRGYTIASQTTEWLLPRAVTDLPQPSSTLIASYQSGAVDKVARTLLPPAAGVDLVTHKPQLERLVVETSTSIDLTLLIFNYPGWRAEVDGEAVPVRSAPGTGLLTVSIPEGRHEVKVLFGSSPARDVAWLLTGIAFLGVVVISLRLEYGQQVSADNREAAFPILHEHEQLVLLIVVLVYGIGGSIPRLAPELFTYRSSRGVVEAAQEQLPRALDGGIDLLAYDIEQDGPNLTVTLYWRAVRPDLPDYQIDLSVVDLHDPDHRVLFAQRRHPGGIPVSRWPAWPLLDYYVRDVYPLSLAKDTEPGDYQIEVRVGLCNQFNLLPCETIEPLFVRDGRGESLGQRIVLPQSIQVR